MHIIPFVIFAVVTAFFLVVLFINRKTEMRVFFWTLAVLFASFEGIFGSALYFAA